MQKRSGKGELSGSGPAMSWEVSLHLVWLLNAPTTVREGIKDGNKDKRERRTKALACFSWWRKYEQSW